VIGRTTETAALLELLDRACRGQGGRVTVTGQPGIGKSALVEHVTGTAWAKRGVRVVVISGVPEEQPLGWAALTQLVALHRAETAMLDERPASVLRSITGVGERIESDELALGMALLELLAHMAEQGPVAVVVDDAQWVDEPSWRVLQFVARRVDGLQLAMIAIAHPDTVALTGDRLVLGEMRRDEIVRIAVRAGVAGPVAGELADRCGGIPLVVVRALHDLDAAQRAGAQPLPEVIGGIDGVETAFGRAVTQLDGATRARLLELAVARPAVSTDICRMLAQHHGVLEAGERAGLVRVGPGGAAFVHPLAREAVLRSASASERREAHLNVAELARSGEQALHRADAAVAPDESLAVFLAATANTQALSGAASAAFRLMERAAELTPDAMSRDERRLEAAALAVTAGLPDAAQLLLDALDTADRVTSSRAALVRGGVAKSRGDLAGARRLFHEAANGPDATSGDRTAALLAEAVVAARSSDVLSVIGATEAILAMSDADEGMRTRARFLHDAVRSLLGDPQGLEALTRSARRIVSERMDVESLRFYAETVPLLLARSGSQPELLQVTKALTAKAVELQVPTVTVALLVAEATYHSRSDAVGCLSSSSRALEMIDEWGLDEHRPFALGQAANAAAILGDENALTLADEMAAYEGITADALARIIRGAYHLTVGDYARVVEAFDGFHEEHRTTVSIGFYWHVDLAEAALRIGRDDLARSIHEDLNGLADAVGHPWMAAARDRIGGLVETNRDTATSLFERSTETFTAHGYGIAASRTRLAWAEHERRGRRRAAARRHVTLARAGFERAGMRHWVDKCDVLASALGIEFGAPGEGASKALTPRELQIARWIVGGATYQMIADQLFLSRRTVETHVAGVYRKMGIHSRAELSALARSDPGLDPEAEPST
jgi:DNA-binding CsgD family transcriptional regulator